MAFYQYRKEQQISASLDELWDFISSPENLKTITPPQMGFDILSPDLPDKIYEGMIISYRVKPVLGLSTIWVTEITHVRDRSYFVDEQRIGPYRMWHHHHILEPREDLVVMKDIVSYQPPLGLLGSLANHLFIQTKLDEIFEYRSEVLHKIFNS